MSSSGGAGGAAAGPGAVPHGSSVRHSPDTASPGAASVSGSPGSGGAWAVPAAPHAGGPTALKQASRLGGTGITTTAGGGGSGGGAGGGGGSGGWAGAAAGGGSGGGAKSSPPTTPLGTSVSVPAGGGASASLASYISAPPPQLTGPDGPPSGPSLSGAAAGGGGGGGGTGLASSGRAGGPSASASFNNLTNLSRSPSIGTSQGNLNANSVTHINVSAGPHSSSLQGLQGAAAALGASASFGRAGGGGGTGTGSGGGGTAATPTHITPTPSVTAGHGGSGGGGGGGCQGQIPGPPSLEPSLAALGSLAHGSGPSTSRGNGTVGGAHASSSGGGGGGGGGAHGTTVSIGGVSLSTAPLGASGGGAASTSASAASVSSGGLSSAPGPMRANASSAGGGGGGGGGARRTTSSSAIANGTSGDRASASATLGGASANGGMLAPRASAAADSTAATAAAAAAPPATATMAAVESSLSRAGLVAVVDLCVALYKFVNIELHSQGWYAVRIKVSAGPDAVCTMHTVVQSQHATGVQQLQQLRQSAAAAAAGGAGAAAAAEAGTQRQPSGGVGGGSAMPPGGSDPAIARRGGWYAEAGACAFRTAVFRIRYCYEEVKLHTAVQLRLYVTNLGALSSLSPTVEFELLFQEANLDNPSAVPDEFSLKVAARETVTLSGLGSGLAEYYGCTFSDEHFGLCATGLFGGVAGFAPRDMVQGLSQKAVGSSWLCHFVGDGRRAGGEAARTASPSPAPSGDLASTALVYRLTPGPGGSGGSPSPSPSTGNLQGAAARASPNGHANGSGPGPGLPGPASTPWSLSVGTDASGLIDFNDQELRKKVIRLLHGVVEAPTVKHGAAHLPTEPERLDRLTALFALLADAHRRSRDRLSAFLRGAPPDCYAPQNLDVLRALLAAASASTPGPGAGGGAGGGGIMGASAAAAALAALTAAAASPLRASVASNASPLRNATPRASANAPLARLSRGHGAAAGGGGGGGAGGVSASTMGALAAEHAPVEIPSLQEWRRGLVGHPTTAAALHQLDGLLTGLSRDARTDWSVLGWVLRMVPRELLRHLKAGWEEAQPDAVLPFIVWDAAHSRDAIAAKATAHRHELRTPRFALPVVQPASLWGCPGEQPVLVVDDSQGVKWLTESDTYFGKDFRPRDEAHVAIFVHGFQGASTDLCLVKAHLMLMYPYLECFSSKTNEGNTHDSLQDMGRRLAVEMAEFLAPFARSTRRPLRKISLVGHSIGNLILRAALTQPEFEPYKHLLWLYVSVSGPHLGFLYGTNAVVDTGLLLLKSIGKGKCLHQLTFTDAPALNDCYLYRLAHDCPLSVFKLALVISSPQDRYVPYHSSSITSCPQAERDSRRGRCYSDMLRAVTAGVGQGTHLFRLAVDFSLRAKSFSFSKLVGRTAHIEFIESQLYVGLIMWGLVHRYTMLAPAPHAWL
ncbi:hypothetical protein HYH03_008079 [Edaphochlamys debaryana]|uniref:DUF676 domain-containing protein n=1 Tax=Edaphochlamys debaryana TaxID=47281 RepID=A0A835Y0X0_9CHLO|nr:hypothetical protein HYH03_008079 [Edaphochlamys debaryana]|eukprot:KAG2493863.1 hypothetical protein HYH03_008079 [Edaphochlamys debaryana]